MKAFSYLRVSGKGQIDGDGFDRQAEKIAKWASATGHTIEREFREEGVSGKNDLDGRPAMIDLLAAIQQDGVRIVVVERADRFARDLVASELLLREFTGAGVQVFEADGGHDLSAGDADNPTAKLIRQILAAVSEFDKSSIVLKLRAARRRRRAETGRCEGVKPFGTLPGEAETITIMRQLRRKPVGKAKRMSFAKIAAELDERGIPTRGGEPWNASSVRGILARKGGNS